MYKDNRRSQINVPSKTHIIHLAEKSNYYDIYNKDIVNLIGANLRKIYGK